jgi:hypothetical protein
MHPKMMITLAHQVETDRQHERQLAQVRSQTHGRRSNSERQRMFARRLLGGISLQPRLS